MMTPTSTRSSVVRRKRGRRPIGARAMTPAERERRHRAMRARDTAALPLNQIVCGHAATVMASWPSRSIDLIITSPPYWDAVIYDGEMPPWPWLDTPPEGVRLPTMPGGEGMIVLKKHETRQALVVATVLD